MAPPAQQQSASTNEAQPYTHGGWQQVTHGRWARECTGGETGISYNQNVRDGHTELTTHLTFSTSLSTPELIQRLRNAWLVCHATHPEVAIQVSTGTELRQTMAFETLESEADAEAWLQESFHVVTDQRASDIVRMTYGRRLPTKGKRNIVYLVTAGAAYPEHPNRHCLVSNFSHTLADAYSVVQFNNYLMRTVTQVPGDRDMTVSELNYSDLVTRLPVTPITPYEIQHTPTREQKEQAIADAMAQAELYASKMSNSIAMYPEPDAASRSHGTHCIRLQYTVSESKALLAALQDQKLSITFAAAAATILAIKQTYGKGHETGALLGMTRNARRWVKTELGEEGGHRVPCAADVVFLWIPFKEEYFAGSIKDTILQLGRAIRSELGPHLTSPHYISSLSFTADRFVSGLAAEGEPVPAPQAPGFSPQGAVPLTQEFTSKTATIQAHDMVHTGRQINQSAWVGMFSLWGRISLSMGFDTKYYDPPTMEDFMELVKRNLASIAPGRLIGGVSSKL